jgi:hypothetical protein
MSKLNLKNVTAVIVDGFNPANKNAKVLNYCANLCDFYSLQLFSFEKPTIEYPFEFFQIPRINYLEYSYFVIKELPKYIKSDYVLILNHDGYIVNVNAWNNKFLEYDYIGAPWEPGTLPNNARVGNGGFCIRSKKLLDRCMQADFQMYNMNDDVMICAINKNLLEKEGLKFAPLDLAAKFSWGGFIPEIERDWKECFGAHIGKPTYESEYERCQEFVNLVFKD